MVWYFISDIYFARYVLVWMNVKLIIYIFLDHTIESKSKLKNNDEDYKSNIDVGKF